VSAYDTGYCGQRSPSGEHLYDLCENPDKFFYWDEMHPTNAGWKAVMKALVPLIFFNSHTKTQWTIPIFGQ
jgi:phospholipase/lecithinase/hemolysin